MDALPFGFWLIVVALLCGLGWAIRPLINQPNLPGGCTMPISHHDPGASQNVPPQVGAVIASVNWSELNHAYGRATDAPLWLADLFSEEEVCYSNAVYDFLVSYAFHQCTLYSCTSSVILVAAEILRWPGVTHMPPRKPSLRPELMNFILISAKCGQRSVLHPKESCLTIEEAVLRDRSLFEALAEDPDEEVQTQAVQLLAWCSAQG